MAQLQGGGAGGTPRKDIFKRKAAVRAPQAGPTAGRYSYGYQAPNRPIVRATASRSSSRGRAPSGGGGGGGGYTGGGRSSGGGSYSGSGRSGGGVGSSATGAISSAVPKPPSLNDWLGTDSTYVQQKAALDKARSDYIAQQGQSKTQYLTGYTSDLDTLNKNRESSLGDLENDYAGRGLLQSGLYADSMSDMNTDFDKRKGTLEQAKAAFLAQLTGDLTNFQSEQGLTMTKAQQEAAARRAAKFGLA